MLQYSNGHLICKSTNMTLIPTTILIKHEAIMRFEKQAS